MNQEPIIQQVLSLVCSADYKPSKPRAIHKSLKLTDEDYRLLRRAIKQLVRDGQVTFGANHLVYPPQRPTDSPRKHKETSVSSSDEETTQSTSKPKKLANSVTGLFRLASAGGFGFVQLPPVPDQERTEDIFIPPSATRDAMEGDTVRARIVRRGKDGRVEGAIDEIIQRARREFAGTYQFVDGKSIVWLDGAKLDKPIQVGDIRGLPLNDNDKVILELVRFPTPVHPGEGVILKVLGSSKNPAVDTQAVIYQFGLSVEYPEAALEVARKQADLFNEDEIPEGRTDLRSVPTLTIDPVDARDFDDAISLSKNEKGNWELQVHIADVAHFVPIGSALDDEARKRGTSVYLPDQVIPMIPETISNHLASLQPDRNRLAKTVFMEYTPEGTLIHAHVFNSVIRNQHRFNYEQIDQYLEDREPWRTRLKPEIFQLVSDMHDLAMVLRRLRNKHGSLELTLPEVKIDLDKMGKVRGAHLVHHTVSHQIIEEFMLAANQAVASWLDHLELPFLRRAHAPPNRLKLRRLNEFVRALGIPAENMEDRFEIQRVVNAVRGQPTEYAVNYAILKSMSKAVYQAQFERHYALDMSHYCHFTSPIRRYPDLVVHRIVQKLLDGRPAREDEHTLEQLGLHCSNTEQNAEFAERELIRVKLLHFLAKKQGELLTGVVAGVRSSGVTVRAIEVPVDGIMTLRDLPPDRYRFDRDTHTLEGFKSGNRFRLGDELIVRIQRVDTARRELHFSLEKVAKRVVPAPPLGRSRSNKKTDQDSSKAKGKRKHRKKR
ncbi:MAG: VacB/RNase II family 3'-5' exoribonuclease [Pirellula sp.]